MTFRDFQAVIDAGDPINHIKDAADRCIRCTCSRC